MKREVPEDGLQRKCGFLKGPRRGCETEGWSPGAPEVHGHSDEEPEQTIIKMSIWLGGMNLQLSVGPDVVPKPSLGIHPKQ